MVQRYLATYVSDLMPVEDWDPLDEEFQKLEREVHRRYCKHEEYVSIARFGAGMWDVVCSHCGFEFTLR